MASWQSVCPDRGRGQIGQAVGSRDEHKTRLKVRRRRKSADKRFAGERRRRRMTQQTGGGQSEDSEATSRFNALKSSVRRTLLKEEAGG